MKLLDILYEQVLLNENIAQAEKILNQSNIPLDNPEYLNLKDTLLKNGNIRYLGFLLSLSLEHINKTNSPITPLFKLSLDLYNMIKNNEQYIKLLPKSFFDYKSYNELLGDLTNLKGKSNCVRFSKLIINKEVKNEFLSDCGSNNENIEYYLNNIEGTKLATSFKKKINRYGNVDSLMNYLNQIIKLHKEGFIYENWKKKIGSNSSDFKLVYDDSENERMLVLTKTWDGVKTIGSPSWCIYQSHQHFINYTNNGKDNLYVFLDFTADDLNYSIIGFTMDESGVVTASHLMDDAHIENVTGYLKKIGVLYKFKTINKEISQIKDKKSVTDNIVSYLKDTENGDEDFGYNYTEYYIKYINDLLNLDDDSRLNHWNLPSKNENLERNQSKIESIKNGYIREINYSLRQIKTTELLTSTLINYLKIFQEFMVAGVTYDDDGYKIEPHIKVNLFEDNLLNINEDFVDKELINKSLINVFVRYQDLKQQTYNWFIKKLIELNGREKVFEFIRLRKERSSQDYSPVEFFNIKDKKNMVPQIIEKIKKSRREGVIDLTPAEVRYGVKNGLKSQLKNLYSLLIPYFKENQVDYDSMQIFQELGMMKELTTSIIFKVNNYGVNSLNSIENSIYQYRNK